MKVLFQVHWEFSVRQAGSEKFTDSVARYLVDKGHEVGFYCDPDVAKFTNGNPPKFTPYGAPVYVEGLHNLDDIVPQYDIVWTHLNMTRKAINATRRYKKPLCVMIHNDGQVGFYEMKNNEVELMIYNSEWLKNRTEPDFQSRETAVLVPPLDCSEFAIEDRSQQRFITHLNCNEGKGTKMARHWAMEMPEYPFLFVVGGYFKQYVPHGWNEKLKHLHLPTQEIDYPQNVTFIPPTRNVRDDVLRLTKVAVVPSVIDTWGMFALECCAAGIPVIAHPDNGFLESLGPNGLFVDRLKSKTMCDLLTKLMEDDVYYQECSQNALKRAAEVEELGRRQLDDVYEKMLRLCANTES